MKLEQAIQSLAVAKRAYDEAGAVYRECVKRQNAAYDAFCLAQEQLWKAQGQVTRITDELATGAVA